MKPENVFIDPSVVAPRMLTNAEMSDLSGGLLFTAVIWVTSCGDPLVMGVVVVAATVID